MNQSSSLSTRSGRALAIAVGAAALITLTSGSAGAHFILETPASWSPQDSLGNPQKIPPCGADADATATGEVTAFTQGETITITIDETIFHPGHYRVALAVNDRSELPPPPLVTPGSTDCGSTEIQDPPVFPVLADGMLLHSAPLNGPRTIEVTLPADVTCEKCTLQVLEFMSNHGLNDPGGCFYHHCADISIRPVSSGEGGSGAPSSSAGGGSPEDEDESSSDCGCSVPGANAPASGGIGGLLVLATLLRRRRARSHP